MPSSYKCREIMQTNTSLPSDFDTRVIRLSHTVDVVEQLLYEADRTTALGERNIEIDRAHSTLLLVQRELRDLIEAIEGSAPKVAALKVAA